MSGERRARHERRATRPPSTLDPAQLKAAEAWDAIARMHGYNEMAKLAKTLGESVYCRMMRDAACEMAMSLGAEITRTEVGGDVVCEIHESSPHIVFKEEYFRSSWEANYARYLNFMKARGEIVDWAYEPQTFIFETIKRGSRSYTPDFRIDLRSGAHEWHEVKGWMDAGSKTRLKRMQQFYPEERVVVIAASWFKQARRGGLAHIIHGWEFGGKRIAP